MEENILRKLIKKIRIKKTPVAADFQEIHEKKKKKNLCLNMLFKIYLRKRTRMSRWLICMYIYRMKIVLVFFFKVHFTSDMLTYRITTKHKVYFCQL